MILERSCLAVVPAYNEAATIGAVLDSIEREAPGLDVVVIDDGSTDSTCREALAAYRELLADPAQAEEMGRRARERVLDEHTYAHRARQVLDLIGVSARV